MVTFYSSQAEARADAAQRGLREKVVCVVVDGPRVLVFEHEDAPEAGMQLPAGGVEPGETPAEAAVRELREESGLNLSGPQHVISYRWEAQLPERFTRQVCHAFAFASPSHLPTTWNRQADGHPFAFRWARLEQPGLDWEMDAALPYLTTTSPA
ncbi:NUDIX domain-containing protein [Deinococcus metallilatus]|uniref:8-oxo-dGTP pyrophosphatase MutT (NUDIX family) n=1 Tax=Deinococcus metallilatus TaxID=1211322 RepID=A0AAJ5F493_9DEIO|nr:NUDIX domain-containing protein [Deinococcus metallilatus]MBB5295536.1 8-oxo-dGTP pyrophosphatase MutT (NUDIX family) [Deinococcus metallilatus]QBY07950.1 NUDIX domain-containing protein [Deinococcus metallilatus]RXJ12843.1 NUDIX domain-containing protein [Deinococcus metallilatus]TLK27235.1 NUDIX domain-containing protein [Deinococcus metallilatus]